MSLGCVACRGGLMKCVIEKRINWALANKNGESVQVMPKACRWQEAEDEVYVSSCGHLYHKKCLFELFSKIVPTASVTGHASISSTHVNGPNHGPGICMWCHSQMTPGNCVRVHLKPTGNPFLPIMLHYINYNNRIREQIVCLNETIKKRENLLAAIYSDRNFTKKLKTRHGKKLMNSSNEYLVKSNGDLENAETHKMITSLNSKLMTLLEESISAKETMSEFYSELEKSTRSRVSGHYSEYTDCCSIGYNDGSGEVQNRNVHLNEGQMTLRPYHHYHPNSHEIIRQLRNRLTSQEHLSIRDGQYGGGLNDFQSSTSLLVSERREYESMITAPPEEYQEDGSSSYYPVTPEYEPVRATYDFNQPKW